jgi:hypothetical protein
MSDGEVETFRSGRSVVVRVTGALGAASGRDLRDAVRGAVRAGDEVLVELDTIEGITSEAIRDLVLCARFGAQLHFIREHPGRSRA